MKKKIIVLTGAGMSAESGINTFRDSGGLWEGHDVMEVASPQGFQNNPALVLDFYNKRRAQLNTVEPNLGHMLLAKLESRFEVIIVTQNVDDLHERGGSTKIMHLHGELKKVRSILNENDITDIGYKNIELGDLCENGAQLRPHIVWFGEAVPLMDSAVELAQQADIFLVIGTSLAVYPAASLLYYVPNKVPIYLIDPNEPVFEPLENLHFIQEKATIGVQRFIEEHLGISISEL